MKKTLFAPTLILLILFLNGCDFPKSFWQEEDYVIGEKSPGKEYLFCGTHPLSSRTVLIEQNKEGPDYAYSVFDNGKNPITEGKLGAESYTSQAELLKEVIPSTSVYEFHCVCQTYFESGIRLVQEENSSPKFERYFDIEDRRKESRKFYEQDCTETVKWPLTCDAIINDPSKIGINFERFDYSEGGYCDPMPDDKSFQKELASLLPVYNAKLLEIFEKAKAKYLSENN
tara:strand:+ start:270 stop:956 length:687 start_codon:yes stop_codon:yes gene_type:complete